MPRDDARPKLTRIHVEHFHAGATQVLECDPPPVEEIERDGLRVGSAFVLGFQSREPFDVQILQAESSRSWLVSCAFGGNFGIRAAHDRATRAAAETGDPRPALCADYPPTRASMGSSANPRPFATPSFPPNAAMS